MPLSSRTPSSLRGAIRASATCLRLMPKHLLVSKVLRTPCACPRCAHLQLLLEPPHEGRKEHRRKGKRRHLYLFRLRIV
jgi:hypothetical protein